MQTTPTTDTPSSPWAPAYATMTIGMVALVALTAFEALAVTTAMPTVSEALGGTGLYALAFGAPLASGVVGMVLAGDWSDRSGPAAPLRAGVRLFVLGLVVAGLAPSMGVLVAGRLVQGLGAGLLSVAIYVVVARAYPESLHPKVFAAFAGAWVVPGLVGPSIAGLAVETVGWRWIFLAVPLVCLVAVGLVRPLLDGLVEPLTARGRSTASRRRLGWAAGAATAAAVLHDAGQRGGLVGAVEIAAMVVVLGVCVPRLVPPGTLRGRRGLPSVVMLRGAIGAAFIVAEVFLPLLLDRERGFSATSAGVALTVGSLSWFVGSWLQGRAGEGFVPAARLRLGAVLVVVGVVGVATITATGTPVVVGLGAWALGGLGMGLAYPTLSVLTLHLSADDEAGANSSALQLNDAITTAVALALAGSVHVALDRSSPEGWSGAPYLAAFAVAAAFALLATWLAPRTVPAAS